MYIVTKDSTEPQPYLFTRLNRLNTSRDEVENLDELRSVCLFEAVRMFIQKKSASDIARGWHLVRKALCMNDIEIRLT